MPPVDVQYMKTIVYLYASRENAVKDSEFVATGFLVSVPASSTLDSFIYLVTNWHVLKHCSWTIFARFGRKGGGTVCVRVPRARWSVDPSSDLAVAAINVPEKADHAHIPIEDFLTKEKIGKHKIGPGDEVFLISRMVMPTKQTKGNFAIVRFGNVAMNPNVHEPYFLVELRSMGGHSGSPVLVYDLPYHWESVRKHDESFRLFLLGINCGHVRDYSPIIGIMNGKKIQNRKWLSQEHTSIAEAQPVWKLMPLLNSKKFVAARKKAEAEAREQLARGSLVYDLACRAERSGDKC